VRLKVAVIVVGPPDAALAAKNATQTIPIVFTAGGDPVASGLVTSLARPGGNLTGLATISPELSGKRLQLLKEALPKLSRVAVLWNPDNPGHGPALEAAEAAARILRLQLHPVEFQGPDDFVSAFQSAARERAGALMALDDPLTFGHAEQIVRLAASSRLPTIHGFRESAEAGGFVAYGPSLPDLWRRAAGYVDKLLKGARPAQLPVEQPIKFELLVNLKTAKALGLTIPRSILFRADEVLQ
jgi:putative ABC transport system substrate-binding protein